MPKKPTYEELEQKIKDLEKEAVESKRVEKELKLHRQILANMAEGVYLIRTNDGKIVYANKRFEDMFGYDHGELVGKQVSIVNAPTKKAPEEIADEIIKSLKEKGFWSGEVYNMKENGTHFGVMPMFRPSITMILVKSGFRYMKTSVCAKKWKKGGRNTMTILRS